MESSLVYIIRGLPGTLDRSVTEALAQHLEDRRESPGKSSGERLLQQLAAAAALMIPLPEYELSDFEPSEIYSTLDLLTAGDEPLWMQLLDALNDSASPHYGRLKVLSPFEAEDTYLGFSDVDGNPAKIRLDLEPGLGAELLNRSGANIFPGNSFGVIITKECLSKMVFVPAVNDVPATV